MDYPNISCVSLPVTNTASVGSDMRSATAIAGSVTTETASSSRNSPSHPNFLHCWVCWKVPRRAHATYCCGAFYCASCLMDTINSAKRGKQNPLCLSCNKSFRDTAARKRRAGKLTEQKTTEETSEPPEKSTPLRTESSSKGKACKSCKGSPSGSGESKGPSCVICWNEPKDPVILNCCDGLYCNICIDKALKATNRCPKCSKCFTEDKIKPVEVLNGNPSVDLHVLGEQFKDLDEDALTPLINKLTEMREEKVKARAAAVQQAIANGLENVIKKYAVEVEIAKRQLEIAEQDKKFIDVLIKKTVVSPREITKEPEENALEDDETNIFENNEDVNTKEDRLQNNIEAFSTAYLRICNNNCSNSKEDSYSEKRINELSDVVHGITKYASVRRVATLNYDVERNPNMSIVSSLEFDATGNHFVVAGVTRKIKIFDFDYFLNNPDRPHFPNTQLLCKDKISSVSWSARVESSLAASGYSGEVSLWDVENTSIVRSYQEHNKRCWAVHFSSVDPSLIASGGDDSKVKIFNVNCSRSVGTIIAKANVCSVFFSPYDRNHLIFGSADHNLYLYDIRNVKSPLQVYKGHNKAVSYVRYLNSKEIVSCSTDSTVRVWNLTEGARATHILKGHINEKNFVGLSSHGDHLMCGSENSSCYFYYKGISQPLASHVVTKSDDFADGEGFVSSVAWKKDSNYALVGSSVGIVQILQLN